jgi:hypothetical protein
VSNAGHGGGGGSDDAATPEHDGQWIFRHDTFGDEALWTDQLRMHEVIATAVDPMTALSVGLKWTPRRCPRACSPART